MKTISISYEQRLNINGKIGYVDFIGEDVIVLINDSSTTEVINIKDIKQIETLTNNPQGWSTKDIHYN
ncbi:hypothetical protein ETU10_08555 [Apibacter muscae]|uniref:hypothetical protein n=1 Tax=Apibacter muscae TaxID=2509004 RepID=UPI0011AD885D|nr:hypothetical protein [Apibacter muscae]TWP23136.1 hypothetical protein ETU10_08555 [Apibacter muscae]